MTVTTVTKRAGHAVPYDRSKILNAITSASKEYVHPMTALEIDTVTKSVEEAFGDRTEISVEEIQDLVEKQLLAHGHYDIARRSSLPMRWTPISNATTRTSTRTRRWASC